MGINACLVCFAVLRKSPLIIKGGWRFRHDIVTELSPVPWAVSSQPSTGRHVWAAQRPGRLIPRKHLIVVIDVVGLSEEGHDFVHGAVIARSGFVLISAGRRRARRALLAAGRRHRPSRPRPRGHRPDVRPAHRAAHRADERARPRELASCGSRRRRPWSSRARRRRSSRRARARRGPWSR